MCLILAICISHDIIVNERWRPICYTVDRIHALLRIDPCFLSKLLPIDSALHSKSDALKLIHAMRNWSIPKSLTADLPLCNDPCSEFPIVLRASEESENPEIGDLESEELTSIGALEVF